MNTVRQVTCSLMVIETVSGARLDDICVELCCAGFEQRELSSCLLICVFYERGNI